MQFSSMFAIDIDKKNILKLILEGIRSRVAKTIDKETKY